MITCYREWIIHLINEKMFLLTYTKCIGVDLVLKKFFFFFLLTKVGGVGGGDGSSD